jgi:hypothetical protein
LTMLRTIVLALGGQLAAAVVLIGLINKQRFPGIRFVVLGVIILVGTIFERWRYRCRDRQPPDSTWRVTGEYVTDPQTGESVEVLYDAQTGEQHYVTEPASRLMPAEGRHSRQRPSPIPIAAMQLHDHIPRSARRREHNDVVEPDHELDAVEIGVAFVQIVIGQIAFGRARQIFPIPRLDGTERIGRCADEAGALAAECLHHQDAIHRSTV